MTATNINFDKYLHDAHTYIKRLAESLGVPEQEGRAFIAWRAVMHTIRDRIHIGESMDFMSQFPMILKGFYIEGWKYHETPPLEYDTIDEMKLEVEKRQEKLGEMQFNWDISTEEIIRRVLDSMSAYVTEGQMEHVKGQLPEEIKDLVSA